MFGYINVHQPELKIKDFELYRSFYCGLCRSLKARHGLIGQSVLSYDMTFLGLLLSALYEPENTEGKTFCLVHPAAKHPTVRNRFIDYAADMNVLLAYYNLKDDWQDDRKLTAAEGAALLKRAFKKVSAEYPRQAKAAADYVAALSRAEKAGDTDLDTVSGLTGRMLSEIFVPEEDVWARQLRRIGFYLGKFIYLMDAYDDFDKDKKKGLYNPWNGCGESRAAIRGRAQEVLTMMMSECSLAFENLPILLYEDILRNILYAGVWCRFEAVNKADAEAAGLTKETAADSADKDAGDGTQKGGEA